MAIHELKPTGFGLSTYFFIDNNSFTDKIYSHYIYLSTFLKIMNVHPTGRPNVHDNKLFHFKGLSSWFDYHDYGLACEAEVDKSFSVLYKIT